MAAVLHGYEVKYTRISRPFQVLGVTCYETFPAYGQSNKTFFSVEVGGSKQRKHKICSF